MVELKYFNEKENWGDYKKVSGALLLVMDKIREMYGAPVNVHCAYEKSGHSTNSTHYRGLAIDFHFVTDDKFIDQINKMETILKELQIWETCGFGFYLDWNNKGFHLDLRGEKARWARDDGKYINYDEAKKKARKLK